jgi:mannitol/fructose-specific phosphotransferase system IIA component (Ntr-type)
MIFSVEHHVIVFLVGIDSSRQELTTHLRELSKANAENGRTKDLGKSKNEEQIIKNYVTTT